MLWRLAMRNIWRNRRRTLLTLSAMIVSSALLILALGGFSTGDRGHDNGLVLVLLGWLQRRGCPCRRIRLTGLSIGNTAGIVVGASKPSYSSIASA